MSRGKLLCAAAATLVLAGAGVVVAAHVGRPDAELIALCTVFHRAHAEACDKANLYPGWATSAKQDVLKQLHRMVPATEAGHRAKAAVAASVLAYLDGHEARGGDPETRFASKMLGDWLGSAVA